MFGRQPVIDRQNGAADCVRYLAAQKIMSVDIPDHPAAAMIENEQGKPACFPVLVRPVEPKLYISLRRLGDEILHLAHLFRGELHRLSRGLHIGARRLGGEVTIRGSFCFYPQRQKIRRVLIHCHVISPSFILHFQRPAG